MDKHGTISKTTIFVAILAFIGIMILLLLPKENQQNKKKSNSGNQEIFTIYIKC